MHRQVLDVYPERSLARSYMRSFGGWGQAVDHPAEIVPALQRGINAVQEGLPALVDVSLAW